MVKRTTISIPDDLHAKMEKWKESINFSKEFQIHISKVIDKKEHYNKQLREEPKMTEIIDRLREEMALSGKENYDFGKEEGLSFAKIAHSDDIQFVLGWDGTEPPDNHHDIEYWFGEVLDEHSYYATSEEEYNLHWLNKSGQKFLEGWIQGVKDFWEEVKDAL